MLLHVRVQDSIREGTIKTHTVSKLRPNIIIIIITMVTDQYKRHPRSISSHYSYVSGVLPIATAFAFNALLIFAKYY